MMFEFMGAFLDREGDDKFSILQRTLRLTCHSTVVGAAILMAQSAWFSGFHGRSIDGPLVAAVFTSIVMAVVFASYRVDQLLSTPVRRVFVGPAIPLLLLAGGETGTLLGWWDMSEVLHWWRAAFVLVAVAYAALWVGEKAVQLQRSRREGV